MTELADKIKITLKQLASEVDATGINNDWIDFWTKQFTQMFKEESERKECFPRYYLNGVYPDGESYFLISELSVDNAKKSATTYLNMNNNKFAYIHIYTADGTYSEKVVIG